MQVKPASGTIPTQGRLESSVNNRPMWYLRSKVHTMYIIKVTGMVDKDNDCAENREL